MFLVEKGLKKSYYIMKEVLLSICCQFITLSFEAILESFVCDEMNRYTYIE